MKILVVSLLRLGDVIMSAPILRQLRIQYPEAEIHVLVNGQAEAVTPLLPEPCRVLIFDREALQQGLGDASVPFFESYEGLSDLVDRINGEAYDLVVNLTQTKLSGWLMSLIQSRSKLGLVFDDHGRGHFGSEWFAYLNAQIDAESEDVFHCADIFRFAVGSPRTLAMETPQAFLRETDEGKKEAEDFLASLGSRAGRGIVVVQALTSDEKKNWGLSRYARAVTQFHQAHPDSCVVFLGASFERERLEGIVDRLRETGVNAALAILGLEGAFSLLRRARLLLTGDTSIKHLASATRTPILEISIGSGDCHRTGPYQHDSFVVRSRESCAPCAHSSPCHRERRYCASGIPTEAVAMLAGEIYERRLFQVKEIAREFRERIEILRVDTRSLGYWAAVTIGGELSEASVGRWIDRASRFLWWSQRASQGRAVAGNGFGDEIIRLSRFMRSAYPHVSDLEWAHFFDAFEKQVMLVEGCINGLKTGIRVLRGEYENERKMRQYVHGLMALRSRVRPHPLLGTFKASLDQIIEDDISPPFTRFRRIIDVVTEIELRSRLLLKIIRALDSRLEQERTMERI